LAHLDELEAGAGDLSRGLEDLATWSGSWRHSSLAMESISAAGAELSRGLEDLTGQVPS